MATANDDTDSLRDALDAAYEQHATDEVDAKPEGEAAAPAAQTPAADSGEAEAGRTRDDHGRFVPKGAPATPAPSQGPAQAPTGAPAGPAAGMPPAPQPQQPQDLKPPASWRPEAREKWAAVDPLVRQEVYRREYEAQHVLQETAQQRQFVQAFERMVAPYEVFIRQEGGNPLAAVQNLMQTAADLRVGTPQHKVGLVADLITRYGVDLQMLDDALSAHLAGTRPNGAQAGAQQAFRDPRFDQFLAQQQQMLQEQQARNEDQWRGELQQFGRTHEFYLDVAGTMADLVEIRARNKQPVDVEKIYAQACQMHEGVSSILAQRATASKANGNAQAVLRAKRAAASVKGDPTPESGATVPKDDSIRAAIEAAIENQGRA